MSQPSEKEIQDELKKFPDLTREAAMGNIMQRKTMREAHEISMPVPEDNHTKHVLASILGAVTVLIVSAITGALLTHKQHEEKPTGASTGSQQVTVLGLIDDGLSNPDRATTNTPPTFTYAMGSAGYRYASFQFDNLANVQARIFASNDRFSSSSVAQWQDVTADLSATNPITTNKFINIDTRVVYSFIRVRFTTTTPNATWTLRGVLSN